MLKEICYKYCRGGIIISVSQNVECQSSTLRRYTPGFRGFRGELAAVCLSKMSRREDPLVVRKGTETLRRRQQWTPRPPGQWAGPGGDPRLPQPGFREDLVMCRGQQREALASGKTRTLPASGRAFFLNASVLGFICPAETANISQSQFIWGLDCNVSFSLRNTIYKIGVVEIPSVMDMEAQKG